MGGFLIPNPRYFMKFKRDIIQRDKRVPRDGSSNQLFFHPYWGIVVKPGERVNQRTATIPPNNGTQKVMPR
jgi:hypothetical protein